MAFNNDAANLDWEDPKTLALRLQDLRANKIPHTELYFIISDFGEDHYAPAIPDIKRFLTDEDSSLRYVALEVLSVNFRLPECWQIARDFLEHDPDHDPDSNNRLLAASVLGLMRINTQDRETLSILAGIVANDQESRVLRGSAYAAMREIIAYDAQEQRNLVDAFNPETDIDWSLIAKYQ